MTNKSIGYKILHFPVTKIIIGCLALGTVVVFSQMALDSFLNSRDVQPDYKNLMSGVLTAVLSIGTYVLLFRLYEKRKITELSGKGLLRHLLLGSLLGAVLQSLTILVIYVNGGFSILWVNPIIYLLPPLTMAFTSAIFEEILVRGIIFRIMEEKLGSYIALIISSLIFGALHLGNPNSSVATALGLAIQAGLLLGAAYICTRSLWFPIAIHFAWNFTQSGIYGARVSGNAIHKTLFITNIEGEAWYTGGAFGPEGSIQATLFCLAAAVFLMVLSHKHHRLVEPYWKRKWSTQRQQRELEF